MKPTHHVRGFTLIELLVAIVILAVIATLAYRATAAMTDGGTSCGGGAERWRTLDAVFARIEADVRQAVPRRVRHGVANEPAWVAQATDAAGNSAFAFTRAGSEFALEPGVAGQRIGYRLRDGAIETLYWPQLDTVAAAEPIAYPLLRDVTRFRVQQLTANNAWSLQWPVRGEADTPRALRIEIGLPDGTSVERWVTLQ